MRPDDALSAFTRPNGSTVLLPEHIRKIYELFEKIPNAKADISWNDVTQAYADSATLREGLIDFIVDNQDRLLFGSDTVRPINSGQYTQGLNTGSHLFTAIARRDPEAAWKLLRGNYDALMENAYTRVVEWTRRQPEMTVAKIAKMEAEQEILSLHHKRLGEGARQESDNWLALLKESDRTATLDPNPNLKPNPGVFHYLYESLPPAARQHWHDDVHSQTGRGTSGGFAQKTGCSTGKPEELPQP